MKHSVGLCINVPAERAEMPLYDYRLNIMLDILRNVPADI